jgi:hypothetical protein
MDEESRMVRPIGISAVILCSAALMTACGGRDPKAATGDTLTAKEFSQDTTPVDTSRLGIKIDENAVIPSYMKDVTDQEEKGHKPGFSKITDALINTQLGNATTAPRNMDPKKYYKALLANLAASMQIGTNVFNNRNEYEAELNWQLKRSGAKNTHLIFNQGSGSLTALLRDGEMNSYSGTILNQILFRTFHHKVYDQFKFVIVFESGNILPAVVASDNQGQAVLWGLETTVPGINGTVGGFKNYGLIKNLDKLKQPLRVIDAHYFAVIEAFRPYMTNIDDVIASALKETATKYGMPLAAMENRFQSGLALPLANPSPFSFVMPDQADVFPKGAVERIPAYALDPDYSTADIWNPSKQGKVIKILAVPVPKKTTVKSI